MISAFKRSSAAGHIAAMERNAQQASNPMRMRVDIQRPTAPPKRRLPRPFTRIATPPRVAPIKGSPTRRRVGTLTMESPKSWTCTITRLSASKTNAPLAMMRTEAKGVKLGSVSRVFISRKSVPFGHLAVKIDYLDTIHHSTTRGTKYGERPRQRSPQGRARRSAAHEPSARLAGIGFGLLAAAGWPAYRAEGPHGNIM